MLPFLPSISVNLVSLILSFFDPVAQPEIEREIMLLTHKKEYGLYSKEIPFRRVPRGPVLGPLLFLIHIYVNDILRCSEMFDFHLFDDNTNLICAGKSLKSLDRSCC